LSRAGSLIAGLVAALVVCVPPALAQTIEADSLSSDPGAVNIETPAGSPVSTTRPPRAAKHEAGNERMNAWALGKDAGGSSMLCFQPGIGWQPVLPAPFASSKRKMTAPRSPDVGGIKTGGPGAAGAQTLGADQENTGQCAAASYGAIKAVNVGRPVFPQLTGLPLHTTAVPLSAMPFNQLAGSDESLEPIEEFGKHAYVSPIKLRRMMRNANDLEMRIKLRELSRSLTDHTGNSSVGFKEGKKQSELNHDFHNSYRSSVGNKHGN
jgi:hypothetical protein